MFWSTIHVCLGLLQGSSGSPTTWTLVWLETFSLVNDTCLGCDALITCPVFIPVSYTIHQLMEKLQEINDSNAQGKALDISTKLLTWWGKHFCISSLLCNEQKQHNQDNKKGRIITEKLADTFEKRPTGIVTVAWKERAAALSSIRSKKKKLHFLVVYWCQNKTEFLPAS